VISDDCSTDNTVEEIQKLSKEYRFPIVFDRNEKNMGYDRNYRKCIEMSSGDYCIVIGNDDSLYEDDAVEKLVKFIKENNFPDIGFCNMIEDRTGGTLIKRASSTGVLGTGPDVAIRNYSCFSFVGGLIYKTTTFAKYNTAKYDGSIYAQMYLGVYMISKGAVLFSMNEPLILKDILLDGIFRNSYRDRIAKKWKDYKVVDGGLPSVINVLIGALKDAGADSQERIYYIFKRIYSITFPHWLLDYRENKALPEAAGLVMGLRPARNQNLSRLTLPNKTLIYGTYLVSVSIGLLTPVFLFKTFKQKLYTFFKKR
jgi:glycosyltransferase involved in cell wall biosynthesis